MASGNLQGALILAGQGSHDGKQMLDPFFSLHAPGHAPHAATHPFPACVCIALPGFLSMASGRADVEAASNDFMRAGINGQHRLQVQPASSCIAHLSQTFGFGMVAQIELGCILYQQDDWQGGHSLAGLLRVSAA
jgi:hypothetical protein